MDPFRFLLVLSMLLITLITATPLSSLNSRAPGEVAGSQRRGIAFNDPKYVKYFDHPGSRVTWYAVTQTLV